MEIQSNLIHVLSELKKNSVDVVQVKQHNYMYTHTREVNIKMQYYKQSIKHKVT